MAESKWMHRLEQGIGNFALRCHRRPAVALAVAGVLSAVLGFAATNIRLSADLQELLPNTFQSVRDLEPVKERFGGIGYVVVVGMNGTPEALRRFADEYVPKLEQFPGIRYVEYQREFEFFDKNRLYYLELEDLKEVQRRIKAREKWERQQLNPMYLKLDDEPAPSLDMSDIEAKYGRRSDQRLKGTGEKYYLDPERKMVVLMAKPERASADLAFSEKLVSQVEEYFAKEDLTRFGTDFKVGLTGAFKYKVDQQRQISQDVNKASALAFLILLVYLAFHFRSVLAVALVLTPVAVGLAWTYGLVAFTFGSLNVLTGFLGAILGGLGIEHGIHLLGRYEVLRNQGQSSEDSVREAFLHTGGSALVSSVVASLTFLSIAISEFRAFREFGLIAAAGMAIILAAYFLVLPSMLALAARFGWTPSAVVSGAKSELARMLPRSRVPLAVAIGAMLLFFIVYMPRVRFDFDFHSLEDSSLESFTLDRETNEILGYSQEPVVILTESSEAERAIVQQLKARKREKEARGQQSTIDFVASLSELVPQQQAEKQEVLAAIAQVLERVPDEKLEGDALKMKHEWVKAQPFKREEIPVSIRRQFEGIKSAAGGFVLIFPSIKLSDGAQVREFAREVRGIQVPGGERFSAAGEAMILADILEMVIRESPWILLAAVVSVLLAMWLALGNVLVALLCLSPTVLSLLGLIGLMAFIGLPFNYLNIMIVPVLIGVTVDAGVHLISRLSDAAGNFAAVYAETGRAICGGLLTSAVGFGALLLADHPGLNSLGRLANLGFGMNLLVMLVGFPALLLILQGGYLGRLLKPYAE